MAINLFKGDKIKVPSACTWGLQDVSASDSGRTTDALMHKNRITQKVKLQLKWNTCSPSEIHAIMQAFNPEYIDVTYWDPLEGKEVTRNFYIGDRSAPFKMWTANKKMFTEVGFNIIER